MGNPFWGIDRECLVFTPQLTLRIQDLIPGVAKLLVGTSLEQIDELMVPWKNEGFAARVCNLGVQD